MSTFDDFMINQAVNKEQELLKLKAQNAALEKELRYAMQFIGQVPHHVFKCPKEVVDFYERNARFATTTGEA